MSVERTTPGAATVNVENPWPGLLAFRESDQAFFQGRTAEAEELSRIVMRERLVLLFGLSGLGKSSLLQAGVFPRLRPERLLPVYIRLDFSAGALDLVPQIFACVDRDAAVHRVEPPTARDGETLWEYFHRSGNHLWNDRNRPVMPLLVFDQFEEVFTLGRLNPERAAATERLIEQLADIAEGRPPAALRSHLDQHPDEAAVFDFGRHHYKILLSIREDFLPDLESLRARMPALALNRFRLRRMNGDAALDAVSQATHLIDADVARQVVRFVSADRSSLPLADVEVEPALLSVVCRELNNKRLHLQQERITAGLLEGSRQEVLTGFYERSTADLPLEVRRFVEDRLLTVSGYRDSVALENALSLPGVSMPHIDQLVERRLLRREDRGGVQRLELTHDLLAGVVRTSRDARKARDDAERERLALIASQEKQQETLLAEQEAKRLELQRTQEREKRDSEKRELRRYRVAVVVVLLFMAAAVAAAVVAGLAQQTATEEAARARQAEAQAQASNERALEQQAIAERLRAISQRQEMTAITAANSAEAARVEADAAAVVSSSRELSTAALLNLTADPELSLMLAIASADRAEIADTRDVLHRALHASRVRFNIPVGTTIRNGTVRLNDDGFKVASDASGTHVLLLEPGGTFTSWDLTGATPTRTYELKVGDYAAAAFSPDRRMLAVAGRMGGGLSLWNLDTRRMVAELGQEDTDVREFHSLAFSPSGRLLAVARCAIVHRNLCGEGTLDIWDAVAHQRIAAKLPSIDGTVRAIAWSSESTLAAGGNRGSTSVSNGQIAIWRTITPDGKPELFPKAGGKMSRITGLAFGGTGAERVLVYAQADTSDVNVITLEFGDLEGRRPTGHSGGVRAIAAGASVIATAGADHTARLFDREMEPLLVLSGHTSQVDDLAISADGARLVTVGTDAARVWTLAGNGELGSWSEARGSDLGDVSDDGRFMTVRRATELLVVDLLSGRTRTIGGRFDHAPLSGDGSRLARSFFNTAITADDSSGARVAAPSAADGFLFQLEFSGNGRRLLMITDGPPRIWDVAAAGYLKVPADFPSEPTRGAISDDGQLAAIQGDNRDDLVVWDVASSRVSRMNPGADGRASLAFSRNGKWLAGNAPDGKVLLWDTRSGRIERTIAGHAGETTALAFSPDGTLLATGGGDRTIRIWDTATGRETLNLSGHSDPAKKIAFGPDGRRLTVATASGQAAVYALSLEELLRVARRRVTRRMTLGECRQFLHRDAC